MKKQLLLLGMAVAVMASCSKNEVLEVSDSVRPGIGFNTYVGNTTRVTAEDNDLAALKEEGMGFYVHGQYKKTDGSGAVTEAFRGDEQAHVTWGGSSWGYTPLTYWLAGNTYKFAAFAPALAVDHKFDYATNQLTITNFVADGATDLVVAATTPDGVASDTYISNNTPINFNFKHALSKVKFTFKNGWRDQVKMVINNIQLTNVDTQGTLTTPANLNSQAPSLSNWAAGNKLSEAATYQDVTGTGSDGLTTYEQTYEYEHFLMPQTLTKAPGSEIKLTFTVTITNDQNQGPDIDGAGHNYKTITATLPTAAVTEWTPSYAYNYVITINGDTFGLKPIQFDVDDVTAWGTPTQGDQTIVDLQ